MTTSSVTQYQLTQSDLVKTVLRKLTVLSEGQTPSFQNEQDAKVALNTTLARFRGLGMPLWARVEHTFVPTTDYYEIGVGKTLNVPYPVKLISALRKDINGTPVTMEIRSREDFLSLPNNSAGSPIIISYQPQVNWGKLWVWPSPPATSTTEVTLVYQRPFEYFTTSGETLDFPEEWYDAIIYDVAVKLAPEWSIPLADRQFLKKEAEQYLADASVTGQDIGSFFVSPSREL